MFHVFVDRLHHQKVDSAAKTSKRELQTKNHIELLALEPENRVIVLSDRQRFRTDAENESTEQHDIEGIRGGAECKHQLTNHQNEHVDNCAESNAKHSIDKKTADEAENHIGPGVDGIQHRKLGRGDIQVGLEVVLKGAGIIIAKV